MADFTVAPRWPLLEERDGVLRMPEGGRRLPLMYPLRARLSS